MSEQKVLSFYSLSPLQQAFAKSVVKMKLKGDARKAKRKGDTQYYNDCRRALRSQVVFDSQVADTCNRVLTNKVAALGNGEVLEKIGDFFKWLLEWIKDNGPAFAESLKAIIGAIVGMFSANYADGVSAMATMNADELEECFDDVVHVDDGTPLGFEVLIAA